jgi:VIT1/CCC1 family predicted Fe2+/Mn2+ transporter
MDAATPAKPADRLAGLRNEKHCAVLYRAMERVERDPHKRALFHDLAANAERQLAVLTTELGVVGAVRESLRCRIVALAVRLFGVRLSRPLLAAMKIRGLSVYAGAKVHRPPMPRTAAEVRERHRADTSGALRAAVFGVNDGLVSNTCLILGIAGAVANNQTILLTGVAGLLAGAFSMAAGEYVSMRSQRELYEYQIGLERDELGKYPDHQAEELAIIFHARGVALDEARTFAKRLIANPEEALDTIAREELGLNPEELGSPWGAAGSSFVSFSTGAFVPLVPFLADPAIDVLQLSAVLAGIALFLVGAALSLFSGKSAWRGGLRMLVIGTLAAGASFGIGKLLGVGLAG